MILTLFVVGCKRRSPPREALTPRDFQFCISRLVLHPSPTAHIITTMPPRIQPHRVQVPSSVQCFRTRPAELVCEQTRQYRHLTKPPYVNPKMKRLRRDMQEWLNGPGKVFREPLPGSTNYMAAYDKQGNLIRTRRRNQGEEEDVEQDAIPVEREPEIRKQEEEDGLDEQEMQKRYEDREFVRQRKAERDARGGIPRERTFDMRPYPLNQNFRSQPVLSEELREVIHQQVAINGVDVSTVSAAFSVDTRRVAAVVRLKTIEKQWLEEVSHARLCFHPLFNDDSIQKSISL